VVIRRSSGWSRQRAGRLADCGTGRHFRTLARADSDRTARRRW